MHYHREWQRNRSGTAEHAGATSLTKVAVGRRPCAVCGYDRIRSHVHRLVRDLGYTMGNMVAVCARCHDEIHYKLIPPPPATTL